MSVNSHSILGEKINGPAQEIEALIISTLEKHSINVEKQAIMSETRVVLFFRHDSLEHRVGDVTLIPWKNGDVEISLVASTPLALQAMTGNDQDILAECHKQIEALREEILKKFSDKKEENAKPAEPELPKPGSTIYEWLDYRHKYTKITGKKITYKKLAELSLYAIGSFEQAARNWKNERGIT